MKFRSIAWRWPLALLALAAFLVLAVACGDDDDSGGGPGATTPAAGGGQTPGDGGSGGDPGAELQQLGQAWTKITARVTYQAQTSYQGATTETTMTFYSRPPDSRFDIESAGAGRAIFINTGGGSYICSETGGTGTCFSSPSQSGAGGSLPFFSDFADPAQLGLALSSAAGGGVERFDDEIAGESANCFRSNAAYTAGAGEATWCFADDGLLLLLKFSGDTGSATYRATSLDRNLSDADFEPPYAVTELPGT